MSESFFVMLQDGKHFDHATLINSPLIIKWNVNTRYKSDSYWNCFLRNNTSS